MIYHTGTFEVSTPFFCACYNPGMSMEDTLRRFGEQFEWQPEVQNKERLSAHKHFIVAGMGGSHLGADLIKNYGKIANLLVHKDYGMPGVPDGFMQDVTVILSSYSGNTEETLDAGLAAHELGLPIVAISTGGKLIEFAKEHNYPYVQIPDMGLQPRMAIGFSMLGIARLMQNRELEESIRESGKRADPMAFRDEGARVAEIFVNKTPVFYSSEANSPLAYIFKIKINETAKAPAYCNAFPELCHNELTGFDIVDSTRPISSNICIVMLDDFSDHPRVRVRMNKVAEIYGERGLTVEKIPLAGKTGFEKAFNLALLGDWVSMNLAKRYGVPDEAVPLVEDFKKRIG
jgi:glucose/mannose-6-phosphate isomerase